MGGSFEPPFEPPEWYNRYDCIIFFVPTNTYGHPSPETLERLKDAGVQVLITKDTGAAAIWKSTMSTTQKNLSEKKFSVGIFGVSKNGGR